MTEKNFKFLKKLRKWRSDLEGDEADFRILREHQQFMVKVMVFFPFQVAYLMLRFENLTRSYGLAVLVILVGVAFWHWWRIEKCRSELEDDLMAKTTDFLE